MRLPRDLAEAAAAAWRRDETDPVGDETPEQHRLRDHAAELALIGLAVTERGGPDGDHVRVALTAPQIAAAIRARPPRGPRS